MSTLAQLMTAAPSTTIDVEGWEYTIGDRGGEGSIRFFVLGTELQAFCDVLAGKPATTLVIGGNSVDRFIPLRHPRDGSMYAYSSRIAPPEGIVADEGPTGSGWGIDFELYRADVRFRVPAYSFEGSYPMTRIGRDVGIEMRTRPGYGYKYPSDNLRVPHDVGVPVQVAQYSLTFSGLTSLDDSLYDSLLGKVNSTTFMGKPPGTMLYEGCGSSGQYQLGGIPAFEATQRFRYSRVPHRQLMRPDGASFEAPVQAGDATKYLFEEADLNVLYA